MTKPGTTNEMTENWSQTSWLTKSGIRLPQIHNLVEMLLLLTSSQKHSIIRIFGLVQTWITAVVRKESLVSFSRFRFFLWFWMHLNVIKPYCLLSEGSDQTRVSGLRFSKTMNVFLLKNIAYGWKNETGPKPNSDYALTAGDHWGQVNTMVSGKHTWWIAIASKVVTAFMEQCIRYHF